MKNGYLYLFENINGLELLVGSLNVREIFINKSFIKQNYVLIGLSHDMKIRQEVFWRDIKSHLVKDKVFSIQDFTKQYVKEIEYIYHFKEKIKIDLSWLEIFQIAAMLKLEDQRKDNLVEQIMSELKSFSDYAKKMY